MPLTSDTKIQLTLPVVPSGREVRALTAALRASARVASMTPLWEASAFAEDQLRSRGELGAASGVRFFAMWARFVKYADASGAIDVGQCRWAALSTVVATRQPALWAMGEAGASTAEIAKVAVCDVDLSAGRVWLPGAPRTDARWAPLTAWGAAQLARRLRSLSGPPDQLVAFDRDISDRAGRISAGASLGAIMARAGLADERDVKPRSLSAWAGRRVWLETGRIDEVARRLGLRSLDLTAELIGFNWSEHEVPS